MITVRRYLDNVEAELALGRLQADGIDCRLQNTALQNISHALVDILLQVDEDDLVLADRRLKEMEAGDVEIDENWGEEARGDSPY